MDTINLKKKLHKVFFFEEEYNFYVKLDNHLKEMLNFYFISYFKINSKIDYIFKYKKRKSLEENRKNYFL